MGLKEEVQSLKKEKNAVILAHNYQLPEVQDVADVVGDSLELARKAAAVDCGLIVLCGVDFMAETAKIINPRKKVLIPEREAMCPMAKKLTVGEIERAKKEHPKAAVLLYINTLAECKAHADYICTSANAVKVAGKIPSDEVIFGPDENLCDYVAEKVGGKKFYPIPKGGNCSVHALIGAEEILMIKELHPKAEIIAHPECIREVRELANAVESTSGMIRAVKESGAGEFIIATEKEMAYRLKKEFPDREFYAVKALCPNMKKTNLRKVRDSLLYGKYEVDVPASIADKARRGIERMLEMSK